MKGKKDGGGGGRGEEKRKKPRENLQRIIMDGEGEIPFILLG